MYSNRQNHSGVSRRDALWRFGGGLGGLALASMLDRDQALAADATAVTAARAHGGVLEVMHFPPRATRVAFSVNTGRPDP